MVYIAAEGEKTERDYTALLNKAYGEREKFLLKFHGAKNGLRLSEVVDLVFASASDPSGSLTPPSNCGCCTFSSSAARREA